MQRIHLKETSRLISFKCSGKGPVTGPGGEEDLAEMALRAHRTELEARIAPMVCAVSSPSFKSQKAMIRAAPTDS